MIDALMRYRQHLGLSQLPQKRESIPLLCALPPTGAGQAAKLNNRPQGTIKGITARRLNQILKAVFAQAADMISVQSLDKAERLRQASAHWGRHTAITGMVDDGIAESIVQKGARHSDRRTTQLYIHTEEAAWHAAAQQRRLKWENVASPKKGEDTPQASD